RVPELRGAAGLVQEAVAAPLLLAVGAAAVGGEDEPPPGDLDGDDAVELGVARPVDDPEGATADLFEDLVLAQSRPAPRWPRVGERGVDPVRQAAGRAGSGPGRVFGRGGRRRGAAPRAGRVRRAGRVGGPAPGTGPQGAGVEQLPAAAG